MLVLEERKAGLLLQPREPYCSGWTMFVALTLITCATKEQYCSYGSCRLSLMSGVVSLESSIVS